MIRIIEIKMGVFHVQTYVCTCFFLDIMHLPVI